MKYFHILIYIKVQYENVVYQNMYLKNLLLLYHYTKKSKINRINQINQKQKHNNKFDVL